MHGERITEQHSGGVRRISSVEVLETRVFIVVASEEPDDCEILVDCTSVLGLTNMRIKERVHRTCGLPQRQDQLATYCQREVRKAQTKKRWHQTPFT